jgi:hypothetical protein
MTGNVALASPAGTVRFREAQRRRLWWLPPILIGAMMGSEVLTLILRAPDVPLLATALVRLGFFGWLVSRMPGPVFTIEVDDTSLHLLYSHRHRRTIPLASIRGLNVVSYYPWIDGAWGVRRGSALRVGIDAVEHPEQDAFVLVGTQHPEELREALQAA